MSTVIMAGFMFAYVVEVVTHLIRASLTGRGECESPTGVRIAVAAFTHHHDDHTAHKHSEAGDAQKTLDSAPVAVNIDTSANEGECAGWIHHRRLTACVPGSSVLPVCLYVCVYTLAEAAVKLTAAKQEFSLATAHPVVWVVLIGGEWTPSPLLAYCDAMCLTAASHATLARADLFHNVVDGIAIAAAFLVRRVAVPSASLQHHGCDVCCLWLACALP